MNPGKVATLALLAGLLAPLCPAHAENQTLPTDILNANYYQARYDFSYSQQSADIQGVTVKGTPYESKLTLAAGLGGDFQVAVSVPYQHNSGYGFSPGLENVSAQLRYRFYQSDDASLRMTAAFDVARGSVASGELSVKTIEYIPSLSISKSYRWWAPYATYRADIRTVDTGDVSDRHELAAGSLLTPHRIATVDLKAVEAYNTAAGTAKGSESYGAGATLYLKVANNLCVIPGYNYSTTPKISYSTGNVTKSVNENRYSLGLQYLF